MKRKRIFTHFIKMYGTRKGKDLGCYGDFGKMKFNQFSSVSENDKITRLIFLQNENELQTARNLTGLIFK